MITFVCIHVVKVKWLLIVFPFRHVWDIYLKKCQKYSAPEIDEGGGCTD